MQHSAVELSIVIPVYGEAERLFRCLEAVRVALAHGSGASSEIIVADDCSPGDLVATTRRRFPEVQVIEGEANVGFGGNANRGAFAASGRVMCLLNSDMYVDPSYFVGCTNAFEDPEVFAVSGRILEPTGANAGRTRLELRPDTARVWVANAADAESDEAAFIPYAGGGGAFFRRAAFIELGGFDPQFAPYYWEDTDLGYRAWKRGSKILYDPRRSLIHDHRASIGRERKRKVQRVRARNRQLFIWRNLTCVSLPRILLRGTLRSALHALVRLRLRRLFWMLAALRALPEVARFRARSRPFETRSDAEVAELLAKGMPK